MAETKFRMSPRPDWIGLCAKYPEPADLLADLHPETCKKIAFPLRKSYLGCAADFFKEAWETARRVGADVCGNRDVLPLADRMLAGDVDGFDEELASLLSKTTIGRGAMPFAGRLDLPELRDDGRLRALEAEAAEARKSAAPGDAEAAFRYARLFGLARERRRDALKAAGPRDSADAGFAAGKRLADWRSGR